jgi:hypothetical protein
VDDVKLPWYIDLLNINVENHDLTVAKGEYACSVPLFRPSGDGAAWSSSVANAPKQVRENAEPECQNRLT